MDFPEKATIGVIGDARVLIRDFAGKVIGPHDELELPPSGLVMLDHALALRDRLEKQRAMMQLAQFRRTGGTVLIASHDEELLEEICDELWWIVDGRIEHRGAPEEVLRAYRMRVVRALRESGNGLSPEIAPSMRRGDGRARIERIDLLGEGGQPSILWRSGEEVRIQVGVRFERAVADPVIGMMIRTRIGLNVYGTNTELERIRFGPCAAGDKIEATFSFRCDLCPAEYTLTIASHDPDGVWHEWLEDAVAFSVVDSRYTAGVANLRAKVDVVRQA